MMWIVVVRIHSTCTIRRHGRDGRGHDDDIDDDDIVEERSKLFLLLLFVLPCLVCLFVCLTVW